jgi:hypothetical protein
MAQRDGVLMWSMLCLVLGCFVIIGFIAFACAGFGPALGVYNQLIDTTCYQNGTSVFVTVPSGFAPAGVVSYIAVSENANFVPFACAWNACNTYNQYTLDGVLHTCGHGAFNVNFYRTANPVYWNAYNDYLSVWVIGFIVFFVFIVMWFGVYAFYASEMEKNKKKNTYARMRVGSV